MNDEDKQTKKEVHYSKGKMDSHCGICSHFYTPHTCSLVKGIIDPKGWCNLYSHKKKAKAEKSWDKLSAS